MSIYDSLGQEQGIRAAVDEFYGRVTADPELAGYFTGIDMAQLRRHQAALLIQVTGGPKQYDGRTLAEGHAGLGITDEAFDRVVGHLGATLTALGVDAATIGDVAGALGSYRSDIVSSPAIADA